MLEMLLSMAFLAYCGGIIVAAEASSRLLLYGPLLLAVAGLISYFCYYGKIRAAAEEKTEGTEEQVALDRRKQIRYGALVMVMLVAAGVAGYGLGARDLQPMKAKASLLGKQVRLQGTLEPGSLQLREDGAAIRVRLQDSPGRVQLFIKNMPMARIKRPELLALILRGPVELEGVLQPQVHLHNPGGRNGELAQRVQGILGSMTVEPKAIRAKGSNRVGLLDKYTSWVQYGKLKALNSLASKEGALLLGMTLGGYNGVDPEQAGIFRANGLAHLLAVSGTHISLLVAFLLGITGRLPSRPRNALVIGAVAAYALACGLQPAVLRAGLMALVLLWGRQQGYTAVKGRLLLLTAWALLVYKPLWLWDIGFQLSFATMVGLIWVQPKLQLYLPQGLPQSLRELISITLTAQLVTLPLQVWYFHQLSLIAIISNLLLVPALEVALLLFVLGLPALALLPAVGSGLTGLATGLVQGALQVGGCLAGLPGAVVTIAHWGLVRSLAYTIGLLSFLDVGWFARLRGSYRKRLLACCWVVFLALWGWQAWAPKPFTVHFMDVGQGDAALVIAPEGKAFMVDTGGLTGKQDIANRVVLPYLRYLGITQLEALFLSHGDQDHAGGAAALAGEVEIKRVFLGSATEGSLPVQRLLQALPPATPVDYLEKGQAWQVGSCKVVTLATGTQEPVGIRGRTTAGQALKASRELAQEMTEEQRTNEASVIMRASCQGQAILFTGDATGEEELLAAIPEAKSSVLKVSHHGSDTGSVPEFIATVQPQYALIGVGARNSYGHPSPEVVDRLQQAGCRVLRTDKLGAIRLAMKEAGIEVKGYYEEN